MKLTGIGTSGTLNFVRDFLSLLPHISITQSSKFKEMKSHISHIQDQVMKPKGVPEKVGFRNFQNICNSGTFRPKLDLLGIWAILERYTCFAKGKNGPNNPECPKWAQRHRMTNILGLDQNAKEYYSASAAPRSPC